MKRCSLNAEKQSAFSQARWPLVTGHLFYSFWDQGEKPEETVKALKSKGNEFVKKGKYEDALLKYSECLKLNSKECTIYTNR